MKAHPPMIMLPIASFPGLQRPPPDRARSRLQGCQAGAAQLDALQTVRAHLG